MGLSRKELFSRVGLLKTVEPIVDKAYADYEKKVYEENLENSPHGLPWHTSFHASQFPGSNDRACARRALYELCDFPQNEPIGRQLRGQAESGQAIEEMIVKRFSQAGILLSSDIEEEFQTGFIDEEYWFTGNCDAIILPPGWNRPHLVEIKSKAHEKILEMQRGERGPDDAHVRQLLTYIAFAHEESVERWPKLEATRDGTIYYVSRDNPFFTHEFFYEYDPVHMAEGREKLKQWRDWYLAGTLPERPEDWKWTQEPCKYCPFKKFVCKPDYKEGIDKLAESHGVEFAKDVRKNYDYEKTRQTVIDRWLASTDKA